MMKKEVQKQQESNQMEGMVSLRAVLDAADTTYNDRIVLSVRVSEHAAQKHAKEVQYLRAAGRDRNFPVTVCANEEIERDALGTTHGGILAECSARTLPCLSRDNIIKNGFYVMLEGIEDPYNFGYAIRSLYAAGVSGIVLSPRNWMTAAGVVCRASAGASERLPMMINETEDAIRLFRQEGYGVTCADTDHAVSIYETKLLFPQFLIVGGEKRGISAKTLQLADRIVFLDYARPAAALSTASAASILAFEIARQNRTGMIG